MHKISFLSSALCLMMSCLGLSSPSVQGQTPTFDPIFMKIAPDNLKKELRRNDKDAEELVKLIRRSIESKQVETAFKTIDQMRREQPNNAVVLAAYAFVYDASLYQVRKRTGTIRERTPQEKQIRDSALQKAKTLAPKLWLPYTLEGFRTGYVFWKYDAGLDLLHRAVVLAPRLAFPNKQLAQVLQFAANNKGKWNDKVVTHQQAAAQYEIALKLDPKSADVAFALFSIYDVDLKDKAKAAKAKRAFLSALPPGYNIRKSIKDRLAKYPD